MSRLNFEHIAVIWIIYQRTRDNCRAVAHGSIIAKLFGAIILSKEQHALETSYLQFDFKPNISTTHYTHYYAGDD